ncbi:hypothetical protein NLG97_g323 [Lecanicillium saksenae]|uniref:Uncharacterized protein n=1 Tax=Lecanicillium saksenae TaxID=468837 RepID=A0ACC1R719_9HYPO|nr:hypothetical protein NLG97_g323 [Lecanicillium saksenae]
MVYSSLAFGEQRPWIERTGWDVMFRGRDRNILLKIIALPWSHGTQPPLPLADRGTPGFEDGLVSAAEDKAKIAQLLALVNPMMERCDETVRRTSRNLRYWLKSVRPNTSSPEPFNLVRLPSNDGVSAQGSRRNQRNPVNSGGDNSEGGGEESSDEGSQSGSDSNGMGGETRESDDDNSDEYLTEEDELEEDNLAALRNYGRVIAKSDTPPFLLYWSDDGQKLRWNDATWLTMGQFRLLSEYFSKEAAKLCDELMLGLYPTIDLASVKDTIANTQADYSFVNNPTNGLQNVYLQLAERVCSAQ